MNEKKGKSRSVQVVREYLNVIILSLGILILSESCSCTTCCCYIQS